MAGRVTDAFEEWWNGLAVEEQEGIEASVMLLGK